MVMMSPQTATMKPAPAARRTSRTGTTWCLGAPSKAGSVEKLYWVLAMQIGRSPKPSFSHWWSWLRTPEFGDRLVGPVDAGGDQVDLLEQAELAVIERRELAGIGVGQGSDPLGQRHGAGAAIGPVGGNDRLGAVGGRDRLHRLDLGLGVGGEMVDRNDRRNPELADILDMAGEVDAAGADRLDVLLAELRLADPAIIFERADGGDDHRGGGPETGLAALDVEELLGAEIGAEAGLGDDIVGQAQGRLGRDHRIAAMGDIAERAAMDEAPGCSRASGRDWA